MKPIALSFLAALAFACAASVSAAPQLTQPHDHASHETPAAGQGKAICNEKEVCKLCAEHKAAPAHECGESCKLAGHTKSAECPHHKAKPKADA